MKLLLALLLVAQVSTDWLTHALDHPQDWMTYWGDYSAVRYRKLNQINTTNIAQLRVDWMYQTGKAGGGWETMPLVANGIMYITGPDGTAIALDAANGHPLWKYEHNFPTGHNTGQANRGLGILGDRLFMVTPDANVVALDTKTGRLLWQSEMAPFIPGARYATLAPLIVKNKVVVGISGGEHGVRGFIDAYDADTGKRAWRFYTVPLAGEPGGDTWPANGHRGGAPTWMTGTYDPLLQTIYWGTGNPGPDLYGDVRKGDNLFSCSLLALDPDTGKLKWYFQFSPHDTHDWDAAETPMLLDLPWKGKLRKVVVQANRNAFFYMLDRETGEFLEGYPYGRQTWAKGLDAKGRPILMPHSEPSPEGARVCPGLAGGTNWMAPSFSPETGLFYFTLREQCDQFFSSPPVYTEGKAYWGTFPRQVTDEPEYGLLKAMDPITGKIAWQFRFFHAPWAGTLATSGGLVFSGDEDGYLLAFDARDGKLLWKIYTGAEIRNSPMTYMAGGRQFVAIPSGAALLAFALPQ